ncbi:MAG: tetratricopeptide repeat protein [Calditrichaeota bacterium]|nr:tetratricopeptide repeat protein [Calditrichota bacterium]
MRQFSRTSIFVLWIIFGITSLLHADQKIYLYQKGNEAYQKGQYAEAVSDYQQILKMGYESPELYYNLGNAYYKLHKIGLSVLYYNRALKLAPRDEDIRHNLELVNLRVVDRIPSIPELFYIRYFKSFQNLFGTGTLFWITVVFYVLMILFLVLALLVRNHSLRKVARRLAWALGILFVVFAFTLSTKVWAQTHTVEAVVLVPKVDVKSAPSQDGTLVFSLHEGVKVRVEQKANGWFEIKLADGKEGWLPAKTVGTI